MVDSFTRLTLAQKSADLTVTGSTAVNGATVPIQGSGQANLVNSDSLLALTFTQSSLSYGYSELVVGGQVYLGMLVGGQNLAQLGGHQWVRLPSSPTSGSDVSPYSGDPVAQLQLLVGGDETVVALGAKTVSGVACTGFEVTPSHAQVAANIERVLSGMHMALTERAVIEQVWQNSPSPTITVWFDPAHVLREMDLPVQLSSLPGTNAGVTTNLTAEFTNYGTPLQLAVPAPNDVISFQQFVHALGGGGSASP